MSSPADAARIEQLWRYPVKSMAGEELSEATFELDGIDGDRRFRVERNGRLVTARTRRELLAVEPGAMAPEAELEQLAPGAELVPTAEGTRFDEMPVLMLGAATAAEASLDPRRFRPNVMIGGIEPGEEDDWVGREVRVGEALLRVDHRCERCVVITIHPDTREVDPSVLERVHAEHESRFGILCDVVRPGVARVGDPVEPL